MLAATEQEPGVDGARRGKLDKLDGVISNTESITHKLDTEQGTLGKLSTIW